MKVLRWFYLPNERQIGDQVGPRKAFRQLHAGGNFSAFTSYSYLIERQRFTDHQAALADLLQSVEVFQPDIIFWQHVNKGYPLDREFLQRLKSVASRPKLVWHDPEAYGRFIKPLDPVMRATIAESDVAVVKGLGYFAEMVRSAGAKRLLYSPESFDDERFGQPWQPTLQRPYDAVMVANLPCLKRIPWLYLPGGRQRKVLSRAFYRVFGARYAVFGAGQGWQGEPYCKGPIAFNQQESTVRQAWLSVNWGQFDDIPMYTSDRLPISMASGVPHICSYQAGYELVYPGVPGVYFVKSPAEALDVADMLLSRPREHLVELGEAARQYAFANFTATQVYSDLVLAISQQLFEGQ